MRLQFVVLDCVSFKCHCGHFSRSGKITGQERVHPLKRVCVCVHACVRVAASIVARVTHF